MLVEAGRFLFAFAPQRASASEYAIANARDRLLTTPPPFALSRPEWNSRITFAILRDLHSDAVRDRDLDLTGILCSYRVTRENVFVSFKLKLSQWRLRRRCVEDFLFE